jgi:type II secretory pathway pseudopilin PulG
MIPERRATRAATRRAQRVAGFVLAEIIVSMLLVAIGVMAIGTLMLRASRTSAGSATSIYLSTAASAEAARIAALPYDVVAGLGSSCVSVTTPPQPYQRCTAVTSVSSTVVSARIIVTPTGNTLPRPDTVVVVRSKTGGTGVAPSFP